MLFKWYCDSCNFICRYFHFLEELKLDYVDEKTGEIPSSGLSEFLIKFLFLFLGFWQLGVFLI